MKGGGLVTYSVAGRVHQTDVANMLSFERLESRHFSDNCMSLIVDIIQLHRWSAIIN
jgi:hypothetical protein